ncbi:hypothetical protein [Butyrivibrio sp. MC2021]|uniref:hypothetical protein n=1 Tax=Butyrivibrio sp. MC2021 TaxID=1408306 RepID=UPI00047AC69E|nr:hypothetical protein [Butyrivibrio sp. MC2021]
MFNSIKRYSALMISVLLMCMLFGCGKKNSQELSDYKENMTTFYNKLSYYDTEINTIDPEGEDATAQLLLLMDQMNEAYKLMADYQVPEEFDSIADISKEAADYMQSANEYYHLAYDGEFDENNEDLARQYYERANSRVQVMLQVLHGEIPEGDNVIVTTQEAGQFSTIGDD